MQTQDERLLQQGNATKRALEAIAGRQQEHTDAVGSLYQMELATRKGVEGSGERLLRLDVQR